MSEATDDVVVDDSSTEEAKEAGMMGWVPKERFRGDPANWVDAKAFLDRGRQIMPILQANQERLMDELRMRDTRLSSTEAALKAANAAIAALESSHADDVKAQVEAARAELREEITRASRDGDHEALADATDKLTQLNTTSVEAEGKDAKSKEDEKDKEFKLPPEVQAWYDKNPDFRANLRKISLANAVAAEMRQAGDTRIGPVFLDAVAAEVEKALGGRAGGGASRVSGGNGGVGRGSTGGGSGKTYADLPEEARKACDKMAARLVGPDRAHKDVASWRNSYTKQFFTE